LQCEAWCQYLMNGTCACARPEVQVQLEKPKSGPNKARLVRNGGALAAISRSLNKVGRWFARCANKPRND
jgi:hypothetical protein